MQMLRFSPQPGLRGFAVLTVALAVAGCASTTSRTNSPTVLASVGPRHTGWTAPQVRQGTLLVYPEAEPQANVEYPTFTTYRTVTVRRLDGSIVQRFDGGYSHVAELALPEGNFIVETFASPTGSLRIPVTIEAYHKTTVDLAGRLKSEFKDMSGDALVKLPDGRVIGYRCQNSVGQ